MVAAEFHYMPDNANDTIAQSFLTDFITTGNQLDLTITGDMQSTPYDSLQPALDGVQLSTSLTGRSPSNLLRSSTYLRRHEPAHIDHTH